MVVVNKTRRAYRITAEADKKIKQILKSHPGLYTNETHVVECAIHRLHHMHHKRKIMEWYLEE